MRVRIRYVYEDLDRHGNVRIYCKPPGQPKTRIREAIGSPEFWARYNAIIAGQAPLPKARHGRKTAAPQSLHWLVMRYYESGEFKELGERTRYVRRGLYDRICAKDGDKPYRRMEPRHVAKMRDAKADTPEAANGLVKALRQLFSWASQPHVGLADRNPAAAVPYLRPKGDGFHTWTVAEVQAYIERHPFGTKAQLALALLLYTGVRRSDVVTLGRQMIRPGPDGTPWLHFVEAKGRERNPKSRAIPLLSPLQTTIDATPSGHLNYLVTELGKPFTPAGFGNWFRDRCDEAGLKHCTAHGLRKAGATIAALNGATTHQLMAIFGWESVKQAELYTRSASRIRLAGEAMHLLIARPDSQDGERNANGSFPLSSAFESDVSHSDEKVNDFNVD